MSRRSYDSVAHEKRLSKYRVTDNDLFECVPPSHTYDRLLIPPQLCPPCSVSSLNFNLTFAPAEAVPQHLELHHLSKGRSNTLERSRNEGERAPFQNIRSYITFYHLYRRYLQGDQGWIQERQVP